MMVREGATVVVNNERNKRKFFEWSALFTGKSSSEDLLLIYCIPKAGRGTWAVSNVGVRESRKVEPVWCSMPSPVRALGIEQR
jgi:hypothetical protein